MLPSCTSASSGSMTGPWQPWLKGLSSIKCIAVSGLAKVISCMISDKENVNEINAGSLFHHVALSCLVVHPPMINLVKTLVLFLLCLNLHQVCASLLWVLYLSPSSLFYMYLIPSVFLPLKGVLSKHLLCFLQS